MVTVTVKWNCGVVVEGSDTSLILDPTSFNPSYTYALITHSHSDHSRGFKLPYSKKLSTKETYDLVSLYKSNIEGWEPVYFRRKIRLGEFEVEAHNAGHILGSVIYEVITQEGNIVYTGDLNPIRTLTMREAEITPCDILIIDSTFGSPSFIFPPREELYVKIVKWALRSLSEGRIPTFQTDSVGNAQELVTLLNRMTKLEVLVHPSIARVNKVYERYGYDLSYIDMKLDEAIDLAPKDKCALVLPKRAKLPNKIKLNVALVSGWALYLRDGRVPIPLSDHADFPALIDFIRETKPKIVLSFHGGKQNIILANYIRRKLGIKAMPIREATVSIPTDEGKSKSGFNDFKSCENALLRVIRMRGFTYDRRWISAILRRKGYSQSRIDEALDNLIRRGVLRLLSPEGKFELR